MYAIVCIFILLFAIFLESAIALQRIVEIPIRMIKDRCVILNVN